MNDTPESMRRLDAISRAVDGAARGVRIRPGHPLYELAQAEIARRARAHLPPPLPVMSPAEIARQARLLDEAPCFALDRSLTL